VTVKSELPVFSRIAILAGRSVTRRGEGTQCSGCQITRRRRKIQAMSQVLSSIQYINSQKTCGWNMGGAKVVSCPGRHLTSLRPCLQGTWWSVTPSLSRFADSQVTTCNPSNSYFTTETKWKPSLHLKKWVVLIAPDLAMLQGAQSVYIQI